MVFQILHRLKKAKQCNDHRKVTSLLRKLDRLGLCKDYIYILLKFI